jgi:hypothetical protein
MREFLLELGVGFAFMGNQYHLEVEGDDFYDTLPAALQNSLPTVEQLQMELETKASEIEAISEIESDS